MMKSFFKKLAFVMALAMVVTLAAPAGSALAADAGVSLQGTKTIVTAYELNEVGATVDFSFQGAPKDWKTTYKWTSDNEAVATVDKAGIVTAVAAGTATITITAGADASYSHAVVVTVKEPVKAVDFEIEQIDTVTAKLTFNEVADLSKATVDDFAVTAIDEMFEYTLFANTVAVKDNVATLTFVEGVLTDGAIIKVGFQGVEKALVASNGEVNSVVVNYGMNKNYAGDAYVYTELDPDYVLLNYKLYDAKGIDVTANYEESVDYTVEWALVNGSDHASEPEEDSENGWQMSFDAKGAATVKATVIFTDEDGEERYVESLPTTIIAKDRPAVAFTYEEAGVSAFVAQKANTLNAITSFNDPEGTYWTADFMGSSVKKGDSAWFAARLTDNRGRGLVTTQLSYDADEDLKADGNTEYKDYGYFLYESSNEDILTVDDEGVVEGIEIGAATILVSFVKYNEDGEEMEPVKVCSKRINVTTDYPDPYVKTFEFIKDAITVTSTGASVENTLYLRIYDQYGRNFCAGSGFTGNNLTEAANIIVSSTYDEAAAYFEFGNITKNGETGWDWAFPVVLRGDDLSELVDIKDNGYTTFKFTVEFDKDLEEWSKVVTKNDKATAKVYNVDEYYAKLVDFYNNPAKAVDAEFEKWNWSVWNWGTWVDTYVDKRTEFDDKSADTVSYKAFGIDLNTAAGLKLMSLPETHFVELWDKVEKINKNEDERAKLTEGAIYYQIIVPSKADDVEDDDDKTYTVSTGSSVMFSFNKVTDKVDGDGEPWKLIEAAVEGTYGVNLYYVNSKNKLVKLGSGSQNITVVNSTPAVKAEGFKESNVYDGNLAEADVETLLKEMYNFSWNGELLYDEDREAWDEAEKSFKPYKDSANFDIYDIDWEYSYIKDKDGNITGIDKLIVKSVTFRIGFFDDCNKDNNGGVDNNDDNAYQLYTLKKRITIKAD